MIQRPSGLPLPPQDQGGKAASSLVSEGWAPSLFSAGQNVDLKSRNKCPYKSETAGDYTQTHRGEGKVGVAAEIAVIDAATSQGMSGATRS